MVRVMYYFYESPHNDRNKMVCVCVCVQGLSVHRTKRRVFLDIASVLFLGQGCLLSAADTDTFQIHNTWGNFSFNPSAFKMKPPSLLQKLQPPPFPASLLQSLSLFLTSHENTCHECHSFHVIPHPPASL